MKQQLIGIDGCEGGWIAVARSGDQFTARIIATFGELFEVASSPVTIAIDIPIGLPTAGARQCDLQARKLLGAPRASSVFPAPVRATLGARTYAEACFTHRAADGRSMSKQCFAILPKIAEVDAVLRQNPEARELVFEIHPELSFAVWKGGRAMRDRKRSRDGRKEREALIDAHWPGVRKALRNQLSRNGWADDDLNDAMAALWSAERIDSGGAIRFPENVEVDAAGIAMRMWA